MRYVLERRLANVYSHLPGDAWTALPRAPAREGIDGFDIALICLFLIGIYTNYTIMISAKVPFPSVPAGVAGLCLLWRRREMVTTRAFGCFVAVVLLYLVSLLFATDIHWLGRRTNGLLQLTYSLTIGYALFLTACKATPRQLAALFLAFALVILIGCLLEDYGGLRPFSNKVREVLYQRGIYENDMRDVLLYRKIRPKFFASEPASVTFCFSLLSFLWFVTSQWRFKLAAYLALFGVGLVAMPGPTLLLMLLLIAPYAVLLATRQGGKLSFLRTAQGIVVTAVALLAFGVLGATTFPERLKMIREGNDPSFFYRVQGPALAGGAILSHYPLAGAGLTGEPFIEKEVTDLYVKSPGYSEGWAVVHPSTELLINYFWLHWIYLGLFWGCVMAVALTIWLVELGVPSPGFVWVAWAILGQASGAYVGPSCWAVFFLAGAVAVLHQRATRTHEEESEEPAVRVPTLGDRLASIGRPQTVPPSARRFS
jgi:hypothetical protein